jgi:hypothetical protein
MSGRRWACLGVWVLALHPLVVHAAIWGRKARNEAPPLTEDAQVALKLRRSLKVAGGIERSLSWAERLQARGLRKRVERYASDPALLDDLFRSGRSIELLRRTQKLLSDGEMLEAVTLHGDGPHWVHRSDGDLSPEHRAYPADVDPVNDPNGASGIEFDVPLASAGDAVTASVWAGFLGQNSVGTIDGAVRRFQIPNWTDTGTVAARHSAERDGALAQPSAPKPALTVEQVQRAKEITRAARRREIVPIERDRKPSLREGPADLGDFLSYFVHEGEYSKAKADTVSQEEELRRGGVISAVLKYQANPYLMAALAATGGQIIVGAYKSTLAPGDEKSGKIRRPRMAFNQVLLTGDGIYWERRSDGDGMSHQQLGQEAQVDRMRPGDGEFMRRKVKNLRTEAREMFDNGAFSPHDTPAALDRRVAAFLADPIGSSTHPTVIEQHAADRARKLAVYRKHGSADEPWTKDEVAAYQAGDTNPGWRRVVDGAHSWWEKSDDSEERVISQPQYYPPPRPRPRPQPAASANAPAPSRARKFVTDAAKIGLGVAAGELAVKGIEDLIDR